MNGFNQMRNWLFVTTLSLALVVIAGCGGGGISDPLITPGSGGTGSSEPVYAQGMVSNADPMIVNGVNFDTSSVSIIDDQDRPVSKVALSKGMVVEVSGDGNLDEKSSQLHNAKASLVRLRSLARGKISRVLSGGFIVNGLAIRWDENTQQDKTTVIASGSAVEVFGLVDLETGVALATYVRPDEFDTLKLTGSVDFYDDDSGHLVVNGLSLEAGQDSGLSLQNGNRVVVLASPSAGPSYSTVVRVDPEGLLPKVFGVVSIEGIVARYDSLTGFEVNGVPIDASSATVIGSTGLGVESGWRVQVTGRIIGDKLQAGSINVVSTTPGINLAIR